MKKIIDIDPESFCRFRALLKRKKHLCKKVWNNINFIFPEGFKFHECLGPGKKFLRSRGGFEKTSKTLWPLFMDGVQLPQG